MKLAVFLIAYLLSTSCVIAKDMLEPSLKIKNKYRCHPWNNPSRESSQGHIQPIPIHESRELIIGGDGVLYYRSYENEKLGLVDIESSDIMGSLVMR